jgi:hypothetical protein
MHSWHAASKSTQVEERKPCLFSLLIGLQKDYRYNKVDDKHNCHINNVIEFLQVTKQSMIYMFVRSHAGFYGLT